MKNQFARLNSNEAHAVCLDDCPPEAWHAHCVNNSEKSAQGVTTPCYSDFASNFEIISCNKNYDFNHNNFYRNGNNQSLSFAEGVQTERRSETTEVIHNKFKYWIASLLSVARNDDSVDCHARQLARARCAPFGDDKLISHYEALAEVIQSVTDCFARQRRAFSPARNDGLFSRNDYGKDFIFDFGNNFNYGFLFNRKIKKNFKARRKTQ